VSAGRDGMSSLPTWAIWIISASVLLCPALAFLMAIAVEILIGVLKDAGVFALLAIVVTGAIGWSMLRKLWGRPRGSAPVGR
jgi:hypothetical protein